jgi:SAM-dependent methyltransferase
LGGYKTLIQADGGQMPFHDNSFASGMSNSVLEHIPHVREVLSETARVLRPGSLFLFCVPNPRYLSELSIPQYLARMRLQWAGDAYRDWFRRISRVYHAEPPEVWADWLQEAGFKLLEWFHYFSPRAMRVLEWGHYFGAPTLLAKALTGRWILAPKRWNLSITKRFVRSYVSSIHDEHGVFTFYVARVFMENELQ